MASTQRSASATRSRILAAADEQFYAAGIRATSADRIIEQVGITKVTFYRHFRNKSDLVVAYLERQAAAERAWLEGLAGEADPFGAIAAGIGEASCRPGFRGCAFINAAAEFPDPEDPVRGVVDDHREWMQGFFAELASRSRVADPVAAGRQLMMLRDGAMVSGYLGDATSLATTLAAAFASAVAH